MNRLRSLLTRRARKAQNHLAMLHFVFGLIFAVPPDHSDRRSARFAAAIELTVVNGTVFFLG